MQMEPWGIILQINEKFHKLERGYRDCIKRTRGKTKIYSIPLMHQALDDSDQTRKYGISLVPGTVCPSALAGVTGERGELAVVNRGWAGTVPGSYTYI